MFKTASHYHRQSEHLAHVFSETHEKRAGAMSYVAPRMGIGAALGGGAGYALSDEGNKGVGTLTGAVLGAGAGIGAGIGKYHSNTIKIPTGATRMYYDPKTGKVMIQAQGKTAVEYGKASDKVVDHLKGLMRRRKGVKITGSESTRVEHDDLYQFLMGTQKK